jgi:hypothetical protein
MEPPPQFTFMSQVRGGGGGEAKNSRAEWV